MSSRRMIRIRVVILLFTLSSLAVTVLNSINAYFSIGLRDRAQPDDIDLADGILNDDLQQLYGNAVAMAVFTAVISSISMICGAVIVVLPDRLLGDGGVFRSFMISECMVAFVMIVTGGCLADYVHGIYKPFEGTGAKDGVPYHRLMYYGGIAQAACGSVSAVVAFIAASS